MRTSFKKRLTSHWPLLCILLLTIAVYAPAVLQADFTTWDDGHLIYENQLVQTVSLDSLKTIFTSYDPELYIPITILSYQLDYVLGELNSTIFHVHNLVLHILNCILLYLLVHKVFQKKWIAIVGTAFFALHPIETETVMWISARKDLLATVYSLSSLLLFFWFLTHKKVWTFLGSLLLFSIGLMCKVSILGLPCICALLYWNHKKILNKQMIKDLYPFWMLSLIFGWIALLGKQEIITDLPKMALPIMSLESFLFGLQKILLPLHLSPMYLVHTPITLTSSAIFGVVALVATLYCLHRLQLHRGAIIGLVWYVVFLAPTFPAFTRGGEMYITADHYMYVPSIGIFIGLLLVIDDFITSKKIPRIYAYSATALLLVPCIALTFIQTWIWENSETLYAHALHIDDESYIAANNLGLVLWQEQKKVQEAEMMFRHASSLNTNYAMPNRNLGMLYTEFGVLDQAIQEFKDSLTKKSKQADVHFALGTIYMQQENWSLAQEAFMHAIELDEKVAESYVNLGNIAHAMEDQLKEKQMYQQAITIDDRFTLAYYNLALTLNEEGNTSEAIQMILRTIETDSTFLPALQKLEEWTKK